MNTVKLNYEIRQDLENNRVCLVLFAEEFQSDENKPTKLGCKIKFTEESIFMKDMSLLWIKKTQDALERELNRYNRITGRIDLEKTEQIYLEIKSAYENLIKDPFKIYKKVVKPTVPSHNMMLAFYKAEYGTFIDKIVASVIDSQYSHVELVLSDGECFSASPRDKGVRFKNIDLYNGKWDLYKIDKPFDEELLIKRLTKLEGQGYDTLGAIGSGLGIPLHSSRKKFCSLIMAWIFKLDNLNQNPESLRKILLEKKYISKI